MALIVCDECEKKVSDKAAYCIGCGAPIIRENNTVSSYQDTEKPDKLIVRMSSDAYVSSYSAEPDIGYVVDNNSGEKFRFSSKDVIDGINPHGLVGGKVNLEILPNETVKIRSIQPKYSHPKTQKVTQTQLVEKPQSIKNFRILYCASIVLGLLFGQVPLGIGGGDILILILSGIILLALVTWTEHGRSSIGKWLIAFLTIGGTLIFLPIIPEIGRMGNQGIIMLIQTVLQLVGLFFLFSPKSKPWFDI